MLCIVGPIRFLTLGYWKTVPLVSSEKSRSRLCDTCLWCWGRLAPEQAHFRCVDCKQIDNTW